MVISVCGRTHNDVLGFLSRAKVVQMDLLSFFISHVSELTINTLQNKNNLNGTQ